MKRNIQLLLALLVLSVLGACDKEEAPIVDFYFQVNGYEVSFKSKSVHTDALLWSFGDDETSTEANVVHTYKQSGEYVVTLKGTGKDGEFTEQKSVTILASPEEILTGGPKAVNGKKWILSKVATNGKDGAGPIKPGFPIAQSAIDNVLALVGLGAEYDNEFVFFADGRYKVNDQNGMVLSGLVHSVASQSIRIPSADPAIVPLSAAAHAPDDNAKWKMTRGNFSIDVGHLDLASGKVLLEETVTFEDVTTLTIEGAEFFGIRDFTQTYVIKELLPNRMQVAFFLHASQDPATIMKPSLMLHLTYEAK
ncbi:PKD domain-containing protein [Prolixibacteraceae bacterium JC049]|nr:PKD domain-containing protein [Prolixibacteraceae bacterium JC049]